jgi:hypothetical protein
MRHAPEDCCPEYALAYLRYRAGERERPRPAKYAVGADVLTHEDAWEIRNRIDQHIAAAARSAPGRNFGRSIRAPALGARIVEGDDQRRLPASRVPPETPRHARLPA